MGLTTNVLQSTGWPGTVGLMMGRVGLSACSKLSPPAPDHRSVAQQEVADPISRAKDEI